MNSSTSPHTDREQVEELVHRYADAVVRRDADQWGSCWTHDARWVLGPTRDVVGRPAIVELWTKAMGTFDAVVQNVLNVRCASMAPPQPAVGTSSNTFVERAANPGCSWRTTTIRTHWLTEHGCSPVAPSLLSIMAHPICLPPS